LQSAELAGICRRHGLRLQDVLRDDRDSFTVRVRDAERRDLVLKRLDRDRIAGIRAGMASWAGSGLTPRLIAEPEPDLVLVEWIPGASMSDFAAVEPPDSVRIGRAIAQLHGAAVPVDIPDARDLLRSVAKTWDQLPSDLRALADEVTSVLWEHDPVTRVLLHGDLVPYNVILGRDGPRFIDPIPARGLAGWDLAKLAVSWRALGRQGILGALIQGYGSEPPLLAEAVAWTTLVYLQKNPPSSSSPLAPHLVPLVGELSAAQTPGAFLQRSMSDEIGARCR
jgi:hypothetical protein